MATFEDHLKQSKRNLSFFSNINNDLTDCYDWQVTTIFYSALHLMNAYIVERTGLHYRTHEDVNNALNCENKLSPIRLSEENYLAYRKLQGWSRRSRYLCHDETKDHNVAYFTYDKHVAKAVKKLDSIMVFFKSQYPNIIFEKYKVKCVDLNGLSLNYFEIIK